MLESTFRFLQLRQEQGRGSLATVFLLSAGTTDHPEVVAVTARHVLEAFASDYATMELRAPDRTGTEVLLPCQLKIREHGSPLYTVHPSADVAVLRLGTSSGLSTGKLAPADWLATEDTLRQAGLQTGDRIDELGFPLGVAANKAGYPILRSGALASYPLLPLGKQELLIDVPAFEGNSGGPVYFRDSRSAHPWILGLVSGGLNSSITPRPEPLGLSIIVPANAIRETISLLPQTSAPVSCAALS